MSIMAAPLLAFALTLPTHAADATAPTTCKDGTTSNATGKGACSGHGGVMKAASTSTTTVLLRAPAAASGSAGRTGPERWPDQLQGRHDFVCHRQRVPAADTAACKNRQLPRRQPRLPRRLRPLRRHRASDDCGKVDSGCYEVGTDCHGRQHRPDRCDRQVQGRNLLQVAAPQRDLLEPRRGRRMVDCRSVATRRIVSRQLSEPRLVSHGLF